MCAIQNQILSGDVTMQHIHVVVLTNYVIGWKISIFLHWNDYVII